LDLAQGPEQADQGVVQQILSSVLAAQSGEVVCENPLRAAAQLLVSAAKQLVAGARVPAAQTLQEVIQLR
jgi:hypothetical protein